MNTGLMTYGNDRLFSGRVCADLLQPVAAIRTVPMNNTISDQTNHVSIS